MPAVLLWMRPPSGLIATGVCRALSQNGKLLFNNCYQLLRRFFAAAFEPGCQDADGKAGADAHEIIDTNAEILRYYLIGYSYDKRKCGEQIAKNMGSHANE